MTSRHRLPPPQKAASLDEQIAMAERAVMARDLRIRRRSGALVRHVKREAVRHAGVGLLLGLGTIALGWWLNRRGRKNAPPPAGAAREEAAPGDAEHLFRDAGAILAGLLPLLWPLLPRSWQRGLKPEAAGTLLAFLAPLLGKLFRRRPS